MEPEFHYGLIQTVENTDEGDICIPFEYAEFPDADEAVKAYSVDPEDVSTRYGWVWRLQMPGYLDSTEWSGPYDTIEEAAEACLDMYGDDEDSAISSVCARILADK